MRYRGPNFGTGYYGDLFHAEFNTGRVMRHILSVDGATYKTEDEVFMKSTSSDSHPTDVLQDADGSMLVVITGGWFIEGCPLSRVAKPDVKGGIYRIRKTGAAKVSDPWGKKLDLEKQTPQALLKYLSDPRPFVADNAIEQLVVRGNAAVAPITATLPGMKDDKVRAAAIFVLARINTAAAWVGVRNGLNDKSSAVRVASSRVLGLAKDSKSVDKLMQLVKKDVSPVRRQAATALGQIGDVRAMPALLAGAADNSDRFVKHAIVHSLITLKTTEPLVKALSNPSTQIRIAALTALDQMDGAPLKKSDLAPVLASKDPELRSTAVWIASHHPEWTDIVISFLEKSLGDAKLSDSDASAIGDLMLTFMKEPAVQNFVAKQLGSLSATSDRKLLMLNVISRSSLKELPKSWVSEIGKQLRSDDAVVRSQILGLIESRRIEAMNTSLNEIIKDEKTSVDFRLKALSARIMSSSKLSNNEFQMLLKYIGKEYDSPLRQLSVRLLNHAELNNEQLLVIAREHIGKTDLFLLPSLMEAFEGNSNEQVGKELIAGIQSGSGRLDNVAEQDFQRLLKSFPASVHKMAAPLLVKLKAQHAERLAHLQDMEARLKGGDVGEGRKLFYGKASCYLCHSVGSEGGRFGPDLTNIGEIRSKHDILEAIVYPSASFAREYETFRIITKTSSYTGVIKEQLPEAIIIEVGPIPGLRIPRSEIVSIEPQTLSMMPPGLDQQLTSSEMASLTAFLEALPYRLERMIEARERK
jgi:putative heme-binding domain-containing protein